MIIPIYNKVSFIDRLRVYRLRNHKPEKHYYSRLWYMHRKKIVMSQPNYIQLELF